MRGPRLQILNTLNKYRHRVHSMPFGGDCQKMESERNEMLDQSFARFNQELCLEIAGNAYFDEHPITHLGDV